MHAHGFLWRGSRPTGRSSDSPFCRCNRFVQPLLHGGYCLPAKDSARPSRIGLHVSRSSRLDVREGELRLEGVGDVLRDVLKFGLHSASYVNLPYILGCQRLHKNFCDVLDVYEILRHVSVSEFYPTLPRLGYHRGYEVIGALSRPVGVEEPRGDILQVMVTVEQLA